MTRYPMCMEPSLSLGDQIKARREAAGLSQNKLAKQAKVPQSAISEIEAGKRLRPSWDIVNKILSALPVEK